MLAAAIAMRGHTVSSAARLLGISRQELSIVVNGHHVPGLRIASKLETHLGLPIKVWEQVPDRRKGNSGGARPRRPAASLNRPPGGEVA